jgi:predicted lipid-binding transport protein (Tim44 family)
MRRTLPVCRTGLSVAAALVLLTACGGSGNENNSSSAAGDSASSAPETSSGASSSQFCTEAPEAISADWASFAEGIEQIAAAARVDFNDQAAVATFQQKANALQQKYGTAFTNVENYLREECQLTDSSTETSAPTS